MKKLDIYELENYFEYACDLDERHHHITKLRFKNTREEQNEYIKLYSDVISERW